MAAAVTDVLTENHIKGVPYRGPTTVFSANETDLSTPDTSQQYDVKGIAMVSFQVVFANYTAVTVKFQRSLDGGTTWDDISGASISTSGDVVAFTPNAPLIRLSVGATLSGAADTLTVHLYMEGQS